jgi:glycolate oxidase iron-sulfur subunit
MDQINKGEMPLSATSSQHFDSCLGCLACVSTCPSGVQYDQLISATRPQVERNYPRSFQDRVLRKLMFSLLPYPKRLRFLMAPMIPYQKLGLQKLIRSTGAFRKVFPRLASMESILPEIPLSAFRDSLPALTPAQGEKRYRVGMILGCIQRLLFSGVNEATVRVLTANGCEVVIPQSQGCCAALPHHQGQEEQAKEMARLMIDNFKDTGVDFIIINAAGCGHTLKEYGHILQDDPNYRDKAKQFSSRVRDVQEFLHDVGLTTKLSPLTEQTLTVVYQDACHLLHGQKISLQPRRLLQKIPGLKLKEPVDAALCCGSAGVYNILQPEIGDELGQQKVTNLLNTGAELIASPNPGCGLQIRKHLDIQGKKIPIMHPMELLDYSIRGIKLEGAK